MGRVKELSVETMRCISKFFWEGNPAWCCKKYWLFQLAVCKICFEYKQSEKVINEKHKGGLWNMSNHQDRMFKVVGLENRRCYNKTLVEKRSLCSYQNCKESIEWNEI